MERRVLLAAGLAAPVILRAAGASAQATGPAIAPAAPAFHRFSVGSTEVVVVNDGVVQRDAFPAGFVTNAGAQDVARAAAAGGPGTTNNTFNQTLVRTRDGLVLLDVGFGAGGPPGTGRMLDAIRAAGHDPAQIRTVAFTHFHGDHVGGLLAADGTPAFPNATIKVPEQEWAFWTSDDEMNRGPAARRPAFENARRRFAPYAARVERFRLGAEIAPGVTSIATVGHSPGHSSFLVSDGSAQCLVIGDAVNTPALFFTNPEWVPMFDMDPPTAVATRRALLERAATERMPVVGYHFPMPATGRVERAGTGYRLVPSDA